MPQENLTELTRPATAALFISDLHLQPSLPRTTQAFLKFLHEYAKQAQQLYLLGDLFESWVGDDDLVTPYNRRVVDAIRQITDAGVAVFWIAGNRDFLIGTEFAAAAGLTLLPDPFVVNLCGQRIVLTHGDATCTDDLGYMSFRNQVRKATWQQSFLAFPLAQRKAIATELRDGSRAEQRSKSTQIMDVNLSAIEALFDVSATKLMIHGHTHRPARHVTQTKHGPRVRYVLPDWECDTTPQRGGWLALDISGAVHRIDIEGLELP